MLIRPPARCASGEFTYEYRHLEINIVTTSISSGWISRSSSSGQQFNRGNTRVVFHFAA